MNFAEIIIDGPLDVLPQIEAVTASGYCFCGVGYGCFDEFMGKPFYIQEPTCWGDESKPLRCLSCPECTEKNKKHLQKLAKANSVLLFRYQYSKGKLDNRIIRIAYK